MDGFGYLEALDLGAVRGEGGLRLLARRQGLTLIHFSAQHERFL
jgi:hypothetical protein